MLYEWGGKGKDGRDEFKAKRPGWDAPIHQLCVKHKVSAGFHGHDHFYAHQELDDVAYVMVPQPGHAGGDRLRNVDEYGYVRGEFQPSAGHIRVRVSGDKPWPSTFARCSHRPNRAEEERLRRAPVHHPGAVATRSCT